MGEAAHKIDEFDDRDIGSFKRCDPHVDSFDLQKIDLLKIWE